MTSRSAAESCRLWRGRLRISVDLPQGDEFEETPFSKWILPISLFVATIFTTLWAGAYQAYNGPIRGPVEFSA